MAKNNEAKIKFTAETGEFNDSIKKANNEMSELRAELKLNETQMKSTGKTVEGLEKQHELLESQLKASESKTEALSRKVEKAVEIFGENSDEVIKLKTQLANARTAEEKVRQAISKCNQELEEQSRAANETENATESLTDKIEAQQSELNKLKKKYVDTVSQYGETSDEAKKLAREIEDLSSELKQSKSTFSNASRAADDLDRSLDDAGDSARDSEEGFDIAKGAVADLASEAIQMAIGKVSEFVGWLKELPEATLELRQDFATLETSFDRMGFTNEEATNTWKDLYAVFGEDDRAVEAANLIAKMSKNQEDLSEWVNITKGIWGTYQDSLPVEGLAEASMETAKTGKVTGGLADALNWSSEAASMFSKYMDEDVTTAEDAFNVALSKCTNEQERQALITDTLTKLYGDAATKYDEASGSMDDAKRATAENTLAQAELGETLEPLTTAWTNVKTEMIQGFLPTAEKITAWGTSALGWMKEHPVAMKVIGAVLGVVAAALAALIIVVTAYTIAQWAMNAAVLANPLTWIIVGIVAAIAAVVAIVILVIEYWDEIKQAFINAWEAIKNAWNACGEFFKGLWDGIVEGCKAAWEWIKGVFSAVGEWINTNVIQPVVKFFTGLWDSIKNIWNNIVNAVKVAIMFIGSIISAAWNIITLPFRFIWENCKNAVFAAWERIKNAVTTAVNAVKNVITTVFNAVKNFFVTVWNGIKNVFTTVWNAIKNFLTPIINSIKSVITTAFNAVKTFLTNIWNGIKTAATSAWNAIKTAITTVVNTIKNVVTSVWNAIKNVTSSVWNGIKSVTSSVWNGIKSAVSNVVNGVKNTVSSVFNSVKNTVSNVWNGIKDAITKPIEAARDKVKSVIDAIKGFFSNLKLKLPNIKMPHFKIEGKFSLDPPSVPKLKIDWYAKAMTSPMILNSPTIFGYANGRYLGGGEAGSEMIGGTNTIMRMIQGAVDRSVRANDMQSLINAVSDLANRPIEMNINGRQFALATASDSDSVNGLRNTFTSRGLVLD